MVQILGLIALVVLLSFSYLLLSFKTFKELLKGLAASRISWFQLWVNLHMGFSAVGFLFCFIAIFTQNIPNYFFLALALGSIFGLAIVLEGKINHP